MRTVALVGVMALSSACAADDRAYSYFRVAVTIDPVSVPRDLLDLVAYCHADATNPRGTIHVTDLPCPRRAIPYELGTFEYTTTESMGSVGFRVILKGINANPLASGQSAPLDIAFGKVVAGAIEVKAIPGAMREPMTVPATP